MTEPKLIVGLGNPGREYAQTRHNIGFMVMDEVERVASFTWREKFRGLYSHVDEKVYLLKPQTFMNLSGISVASMCSFFKIEVSNILVVYDEIELPYGTLVFKKGGGLAGHNGLKSITKELGDQSFLRLRMGIGRPVQGDVSSHVLSRFTMEENSSLDEFIRAGAAAVMLFSRSGYDAAATCFSRKDFLKK